MSPDDVAQLKAQVSAEVDRRASEITSFSEDLMMHPETGFREVRSAQRVAAEFARLGIPCESGLALTGVKGRIAGRSHQLTVGILGELDALLMPEHPLADPNTGAAHACGHHAQVAAMIGAAMGLQTVADQLDGDVVVFAVPGEECIELDWRLKLREEGKLEFIVGKPELVRLGHFDDIDIAMLTHTPATSADTLASVGDTHNGAVLKLLRYAGRSAHAGAYPHQGVNALKAAEISMLTLDAQRELFRDDDHVRVHYILPLGGRSTSVVPSEVIVELQVRARTVDALQHAERLVDRCVWGACSAFGATCDVMTVAGYLPQIQDPLLTELVRESCAAVVGAERVGEGRHMAGSTDMGDLSAMMPVVQPRSGGVEGSAHTSTYRVIDQTAAAVNPAKWMGMLAVDLLVDGAGAGRRVVEAKAPRLPKDEYLAVRRSMQRKVTLGGAGVP